MILEPRPRTYNIRSMGLVKLLAVFLALFCALVLNASSAVAAEEETHLFNGTLSLTGDCTTSTIDPIPDPACPEHPPNPFAKNGGIAVDAYGNRYVASSGVLQDGSEGRIDIFDSSGQFITEIEVELPLLKGELAVDSQGYLYVSRDGGPNGAEAGVLRYKPTVYNPAAGEIAYSELPVAIPNPVSPDGDWEAYYLPIAVDSADNLYVKSGAEMLKFGPGGGGNVFLERFEPPGNQSLWANAIAIDSVRKRLYVADLAGTPEFGVPRVVKAFNLEAPHELLFTIDGSTTPGGAFASETRTLPLAVDEATGHLFVGDLEAPTRRVYEYDSDGNPISTIGEGRLKASGAVLQQMAYDDSPSSPTEGYLFVPSGSGPGHSLAFEPKPSTSAPIVEGVSVDGLTTADAILHGQVNPGGVETAYRAEYVTEQSFQSSGFAGAVIAGEGTLAAANESISVSVPASGLSAGTAYRFRVFAESALGEAEASGGFATYASPDLLTSCPNQPLRTGPAAGLPDCRAYELVTPSNTNGHSPLGTRDPIGSFVNRQVSPDGQRLPFVLAGAPLSGLEGTGSFVGDPYLVVRTAAGWSTSYVGPSAAEAFQVFPGTSSPDQGYSFWRAEAGGSALIEGHQTMYIRYPDGHSIPVGQGSLATSSVAQGLLISPEGKHILFATDFAGFEKERQRQLEPEAAPDGTRAVYDRTPDGAVHVISLKPGNLPFGAGEDATFLGASLDGVGVAFSVRKSGETEQTIYFRYDGAETYELGKEVQVAWIAEGGRRVFFVQGGKLKAFDVTSGSTTTFSVGGNVTPVSVSEDGSTAYFLSPGILTSSPNPTGAKAESGEQNLYRSREGQISFVGTVTQRDVEGNSEHFDGLGLLTSAFTYAGQGHLAADPARASRDGSVLLFKSRAQLTRYDSGGHAELYRYAADEDSLQCLSCNPTGAPASADATLESENFGGNNSLYGMRAWLENLRPDGRRAFFESRDRLVATDTDSREDVYEWEAQGVGSCSKPNGCLYLISSGQSAHDEHLWAVSASGDDAFFYSGDLLTAGDTDETPSIYDARVNGGFATPTPPAGECLGEACQPAAVAPNDPTPASSAFEGIGNVGPAGLRQCRKGTRAVRRVGKVRCIRRHKHHRGKQVKHGKGNGRAGR